MSCVCGIRFQCISISCINAHASVYKDLSLEFDIFRIRTRIRIRICAYGFLALVRSWTKNAPLLSDYFQTLTRYGWCEKGTEPVLNFWHVYIKTKCNTMCACSQKLNWNFGNALIPVPFPREHWGAYLIKALYSDRTAPFDLEQLLCFKRSTSILTIFTNSW